MKKIEEVVHNNLHYADLIDKLVDKDSYTRGEYMDLLKTIATYMRAQANNLYDIKEHFDWFNELLSKLP